VRRKPPAHWVGRVGAIGDRKDAEHVVDFSTWGWTSSGAARRRKNKTTTGGWQKMAKSRGVEGKWFGKQTDVNAKLLI